MLLKIRLSRLMLVIVLVVLMLWGRFWCKLNGRLILGILAVRGIVVGWLVWLERMRRIWWIWRLARRIQYHNYKIIRIICWRLSNRLIIRFNPKNNHCQLYPRPFLLKTSHLPNNFPINKPQKPPQPLLKYKQPNKIHQILPKI